MMYQTWVPQVSILRPDDLVSSPTNSGAPGLDFETWETAIPKCEFHPVRDLVPRPDDLVSSPTNSGAPGLDFETWEITNPSGHRTSPQAGAPSPPFRFTESAE